METCKSCGIVHGSDDACQRSRSMRDASRRNSRFHIARAAATFGSTFGFSLILFLAGGALKTVALSSWPWGFTPWVSDTNTLAGSVATLVMSLGGELSGSSISSTGGVAVGFVLVSVLWLYGVVLRRVNDFMDGRQTAVSRVVAGLASSAGVFIALSSLFIVIFLVGLISGSGISFGIPVLPLLVAGGIAYLAVDGALDGVHSLGSLSSGIRTFMGAYRANLTFISVIAWLAVTYFSLSMGTSLYPTLSFEIWFWIAVLLLLVLPNIPLWSPIALGVPVLLLGADNPGFYGLSDLALLSDAGRSIAQAVFVIAWLSVIVSGYRSALRETPSAQAWWQQSACAAGVGLLIAWVGGIRVSVDLGSYLPWSQYLSGTSLDALALTGHFAFAGLLHGIARYPTIANGASWLHTRLFAPAISVVKGAISAVTFRRTEFGLAFRTNWQEIPRLARFAMRWLFLLFISYWAFLSGPGLATALEPNYDNSHFANAKLAESLKSGQTEELQKLIGEAPNSAKLYASSGLGPNAVVTIAAIEKTENASRVSWGKDYFVDLKYQRSETKQPYLGIIPQWDVFIGDFKLPKLTLVDGKNTIDSLNVKGKQLKISKVLFMPGSLRIGGTLDSGGFLEIKPQTVSLLADAKVEVKPQFTAKSNELIKASLLKYLKGRYSDCDTLTIEDLKSTKIGSYSGNLPKVEVSGEGLCVASDVFNEKQKIDFTYVATASWGSASGEWRWEVAFR